MKSGIYIWTCVPTGRRYVGSATSLTQRKADHLHSLRRGIHHSLIFQRAYNKHGEAAFEFAVLLVCEPRDLIMYEQRTLDVFQPEFNICRTAGSQLGQKRGPKTRAKMSIASKVERATPEGRARVSAQAKCQWADVEIRRKMIEAVRKTKATPEFRVKLSAALRGRKMSDQARENFRIAAIKRWANPEQRRLRSEISKRQVHSVEVRRNMAEAQRKRRASEKQKKEHNI